MIKEIKLPSGVSKHDKEKMVKLQKMNMSNITKQSSYSGMIFAFERTIETCKQDIKKTKEALENAKHESNSLTYEYEKLVKRIKEGVKNEKNQSKS